MSRSLSSPHYVALLRAVIAARKAAGLKQAELADRLGQPQSFVSKFERGERRLDVVELIIIARALGVDEVGLISDIAGNVPQSAKL